MCASVDLLINYLLLKLTKSVHFETSWCSSLLIPLLYVLLAGNSIMPTFVIKNHVGTMWLQFLNKFYSISWELSNWYSATHINIGMQNIPNDLSWKLFNNLPSYSWIIYKYFTCLCIQGKYHLQQPHKCEEINPALERILIHFETDYIWFICCYQQLFC